MDESKLSANMKKMYDIPNKGVKAGTSKTHRDRTQSILHALVMQEVGIGSRYVGDYPNMCPGVLEEEKTSRQHTIQRNEVHSGKFRRHYLVLWFCPNHTVSGLSIRIAYRDKFDLLIRSFRFRSIRESA